MLQKKVVDTVENEIDSECHCHLKWQVVVIDGYAGTMLSDGFGIVCSCHHAFVPRCVG